MSKLLTGALIIATAITAQGGNVQYKTVEANGCTVFYREAGDAAKPLLLAVCGKNDPSFIPPGAEAFKSDVPPAEVHFVDSGHFALESHHAEIAALMRDFLSRKLTPDGETAGD